MICTQCQIELFGKHAVCISLKEAVGDKSFTKLKAEFTGGKAPLDFQTNLPLSLTLVCVSHFITLLY
jgi:hypothetical protein